MFRSIIFLSFLCFSCSLPAVQRYQTTLDKVQWTLKSSPIICELEHEISYFGDARFVFSSGGELAFQLHVLQAAPRDSVASLHSIPPFWRQGEHRELAQLTLSKGNMPVYVGGQLALQLLYELEAGFNPTFHYKDWAVMQDDVFVSVSSANFHTQLGGFRRCINQALPYGADKVKDVAVNFAVNRHNLTKNQRNKLREIVLFAKSDRSLRIQLNGHTDNEGLRRYNQKLSLKRTQSVKKYLIKQGVAAQQISTKAFGEGRPVGSNRSEHGRHNNRRVDVVITRN